MSSNGSVHHNGLPSFMKATASRANKLASVPDDPAPRAVDAAQLVSRGVSRSPGFNTSFAKNKGLAGPRSASPLRQDHPGYLGGNAVLTPRLTPTVEQPDSLEPTWGACMLVVP